MGSESVRAQAATLRRAAAPSAVPPPCLLVIFGASGDLTRRKLVPALYGLDRENLLPDPFAVLGVSRTPYTDDAFRGFLRDALVEGPAKDFDAASWDAFAKRLFYLSADIRDPQGAASL